MLPVVTPRRSTVASWFYEFKGPMKRNLYFSRASGRMAQSADFYLSELKWRCEI
jgi:hypothetical protein